MENGKKTDGELLEYLAGQTGCMFLSDLRTDLTQLREAVSAADTGSYPTNQWNDALHYLLHRQTDFSAASEAKSYLLANLPNTK